MLEESDTNEQWGPLRCALCIMYSLVQCKAHDTALLSSFYIPPTEKSLQNWWLFRQIGVSKLFVFLLTFVQFLPFIIEITPGTTSEVTQVSKHCFRNKNRFWTEILFSDYFKNSYFTFSYLNKKKCSIRVIFLKTEFSLEIRYIGHLTWIW